MRKPHPTLTGQELAIMKVVWRRDTMTVRDVYEELRSTRHIAYTTVMTMMNILETKGYLKKEKVDRAYTCARSATLFLRNPFPSRIRIIVMTVV